MTLMTQSRLLHCNRVHPTGTPAKSTRRMIDATLIRQRFEAVAPFLDERGRRLVAASEAVAAGHGGITAVAAATGISRATIGRGIVEISRGEERLSGRVRRVQAGDTNRRLRKIISRSRWSLAATHGRYTGYADLVGGGS